MIFRRRSLSQKALFLTILLLLFVSCAKPIPTDGEISIYRDDWGIPYIFAETEVGAQFAHGYVQAEDHLEQMLINFLFANGRLSEYFSEGAPELKQAGYDYMAPVDLDRQARLFRFREVAENGWTQINSLDFPGWKTSTQDQIEAFSAGINNYMNVHPEKVPAWWEGDIDPITIVAWSRVVPLSYQLEWIYKKLPGSTSPSPDESENGSNGWLLGPNRTASGNILVQSDPHMSWEGPSVWYEVHLKGGDMEVGGATLYGVPFPPFVHNRHTVTTLTSNSMNNGDVFALTVDPADPTRYLYGSDSLPFTFEEHPIPQPDGTVETLKLAWSHHGPVLLPENSHDFSSTTVVHVGAATMYEQFQILTELRALGSATDLESWYDAVKLMQLGKWHIMVGTSDGHIAYINNSRHPDRAEGVDYNNPMDGSDPAIDWTLRETWSFDRLATFVDPEAGFIQNCNNSSGWSTPTFGTPIEETDWPEHYMKQDKSTLRSRLALRELDGRSDWDTESLLEFSLGKHVLMGEWWIPPLIQAATTWGSAPEIINTADLQVAITLLANWDYQMSEEGTAITLFDQWRSRVWNEINLKNPPPTTVTRTQGIHALNQLVESWQDLETEYGTGEVAWGNIRRIKRGALDLALSAGTSVLGTLKVCNTNWRDEDQEAATSGSSYMRLVELQKEGKAPLIRSSKPWGNSDDPNSPHHDDLTQLFAANGYKTLWFEREDIEGAAESALVLKFIP
jgi:acyl-homoserine-lactone acylase